MRIFFLFAVSILMYASASNPVFAHPQNNWYVPLDRFEVANSASGYARNEETHYLVVHNRFDTEHCIVMYAEYDKNADSFRLTTEAPFLLPDEQYVPEIYDMRGHWRFTLIRQPHDLEKTPDVERAHLEDMRGCYLVWEEVPRSER